MREAVTVATIKRTYAARCCGCGKFGGFLCCHCRRLQDALLARIAKLRGTVAGKFAELGNG